MKDEMTEYSPWFYFPVKQKEKIVPANRGKRAVGVSPWVHLQGVRKSPQRCYCSQAAWTRTQNSIFA